jgi:hypothetical protein
MTSIERRKGWLTIEEKLAEEEGNAGWARKGRAGGGSRKG